MKLLFIFIGLVFASHSHAQDCDLTISGSVKDEHDGTVLSFATVSILGTTKAAVADVNGNFKLDRLCPDPLQILVSHIGCQPDTVYINLTQSKKLRLTLEHHAEELKEVAIEAVGETPTINKSIASSAMLSENSGKPMAAMLSKINGVNQFSTGSNVSKIMINGFKNNRVKIINQGVELQSQQWGDDHAAEIDPFAANSYEVIKGAAGLKYAGGALGGLVIAKPKKLPYKNGIRGAVHSMYATNNRMFYNGAEIEGKSKYLPNFAWRIQGSWKKAGNGQTPDYFLKNTAAEELNGSALTGYHHDNWKVNLYYSQFNSEIGIYSGAHIGNLTDLRNALEREQPVNAQQTEFSYQINRPYQRVIHELAKVEASYYPKDAGKVKLTIARQFNIREEFDKDKPKNQDLAKLDIPEFSLGMETYTAKADWEIESKNINNTAVGMRFQSMENTVNSFVDFIPDYRQKQYSAFLVKDWNRLKLSYSAALRFDYIDYDVDKIIRRKMRKYKQQHPAFSGSVGINKSWQQQHQLYVNAVVAQRAPAINELFSDGLHHGAAALEFGNKKLGNETAYGLNADYTFKHKNITLNSYLYLKYIDNFIYLSPRGLELTVRGAYPAYDWKNTAALIRGINQGVDWNFLPNLILNSQLSLLWGNNLSSDDYLINMPAHQWKNTFCYQIDKGKKQWRFEIGNQWVAKQNRFDKTEEIAQPPKAYNLFLAAVHYKIAFAGKRILKLSLEGGNLLNTSYRNYLNRFRYFVDERGRNIIIRLNYQF